MKIASFEIAQKATHTQSESMSRSSQTQVQMANQQMIEVNQVQELERSRQESWLSLSAAGLQQAEESPKEMIIHYSEEDLRKIELLESFMTHVLGRPHRFKHVARDQDGKPSNEGSEPGRGPVIEGNRGYSPHQKQHTKQGASPRFEGIQGIRITERVYREESEEMSFQSQGVINTQDGRKIEYSVNLNFSRQYYEEKESMIQIGTFHDPVVLDLTGEGIQFSDKKLQLDLNMDGKIDEFRALTRNSGILVRDLNKDGLVNDGQEVLGASSGNGFEELRGFDLDGNQWLDESDDIFKELKLWVIDEAGNGSLIGLSEAGVGALYLGAIESPYQFKDGFEAYAKLKQSSIYLKENGSVQTMHEFDLKI